MAFFLLTAKASVCSALTPFPPDCDPGVRTLSRTAGEGGPGPQGWVGEGPFYDHSGSFQPIQSHTARPMTSSRSRPLSHGSSSVNIVTHCRHEHGMRVMSVPQKLRCGPKASTI